MSSKIIKVIVVTAILALIVFKIPAHWAILMGISIALFSPYSSFANNFVKKSSSNLLQLSIVLLGSTLNFQIVVSQGINGLLTTFISITLILGLAEILARLMKLESPLSHLIAVGTAICGGSAIGAVGPVLKADQFSMAVALGIVFILNAVSVFLLPPLGHFFELTQLQFGTWAALAIHDTSAVVAAANIYGEEALASATTLKLIRALWIIPVTLFFAYVNKSRGKINFPWFIVLFVLTSLLFSFVPQIGFLAIYFKSAAKIGFSLSLFLIGVSLRKDQLKQLKWNSVLFAVSIWIVTLVGSLSFILYFQ
jgi:uncharacterized integral membrane protein (TIGR00698 family)